MRPTALPEPPAGRARYSQRSLPPYRYVPGVHPHPVRAVDGHSYDPHPAQAMHPRWSAEEWPRLEAWLHGVDLFNRFYFWEAHESWEALWATAERGSAPALMLQGLIQVAAALLKTHMGVADGARRLSIEGIAKLKRAGALHADLMGLDLGAVIGAFEDYFAPLGVGRLPAIDATVPALRLADPS